MVFDGRLRRGAGLRLLLAVTDAADDDPDVGIAEAVATVLTARTAPEHQLAVVTLTGLLDADPRRYRPVLAAGWVLVFGPLLLGVLDEVSDQLGLRRTGKPPLRAAALRNAQRATVQQLFATGRVSTRTLKAQSGVTTATIQRWIHAPPPTRTVQGVGLTTAQCAARAGIKPATWRSYVHRGQAPPARGGPRPCRYGRTPKWSCSSPTARARVRARTCADDPPPRGHRGAVAPRAGAAACLHRDSWCGHPAHPTGSARLPTRAVGGEAAGTVLGAEPAP